MLAARRASVVGGKSRMPDNNVGLLWMIWLIVWIIVGLIVIFDRI